MPTYTHVIVFDAADDEAAKTHFHKTLDLYDPGTLVDELLSDADGSVIDHRVDADGNVICRAT